MTKYICRGCEIPCILDLGCDDVEPESCPLGDIPEWEILDPALERSTCGNSSFSHKINAKTEFDVERSISAHRASSGEIKFRITARLEGHDTTSLLYILPADDARNLGRMLLYDEDTTLNGLIERSQAGGSK